MPLWRVLDEVELVASHAVPLVTGELETPHTHTWRFRVELTAEQLDERGMVADFDHVRAWLDEILEPYKGSFLNDLAPWDREISSAENLARWMYRQLSARLADHSARITRVECWMTRTGVAIYQP